MRKYCVNVEWSNGGLVMGRPSAIYGLGKNWSDEEKTKFDQDYIKEMNGSVEVWIETEDRATALYQAAKQVEEAGNRVWSVSFVD